MLTAALKIQTGNVWSSVATRVQHTCEVLRKLVVVKERGLEFEVN